MAKIVHRILDRFGIYYRMFNKYNRTYDTGVDELLFGQTDIPQVTNGPNDPIYIDSAQYNRRQNGNTTDLFDCMYG